MTKDKLIKAIQQVTENPGKANYSKLNRSPKTVLEDMLVAAKQAKAQAQRATRQSKAKTQVKTKAKRKSAPKTQAQRKSAPKAQSPATTRKSKGKLPKSVKARAAKIVAGIKADKIAMKQGKSKPADYAGIDTRAKYDHFIALYAGVRITKGRSKAKAKGASITDIYNTITSTHKRPYYLSSGYRVQSFVVGGGKSGPGVIRSIPGSGAKGFKQLTEPQQRGVLAFLNTAQGQQLRSKGAPKLASGSPSRYW